MQARTFALSGLVLATILCHPQCGRAQNVGGPDPFRTATDRLRNLSSYVDAQLQSVDAVTKAASRLTTQQSGQTTMAFSELKGVGNTKSIDNLMRFHNMEPRVQPLQLDLLQNHQSTLEKFSQTLHQAQSDIASLQPEQAKARLDAIVVPPDVQQLLMQGSGRTLPLPPHLRPASLSSPMTLTPYVIGPGSAATVAYPSVAEVAYAWPDHGSAAICTGTLISPDTVLTAAHCFCEFANTRTGTACANATYLRGLEPVKPTDVRFINVYFHDRGPLPVKEIIIHPNYNFPQKDLAILKLQESINDIMPAPLNTSKSPAPGELATIVGFGMHGPMKADGGPIPGGPIGNSEGLKLWATVDTAACKDPRLDGDICWSYQERVEDKILGTTCHGDSGGPTFASIDGALKLVGVTSGGPDDCHAGTDQSYDVDVQKNLTWITSISGSNNNPAFAANSQAFVSNPGVRAFGSPYHLFVTRPDQFTASFFVPASLKSIRINVNTTPTFSNLNLKVFAPNAQNAGCDITTSDAFATCNITSPASGTWRVQVTGSGPQESQVVATATQ